MGDLDLLRHPPAAGVGARAARHHRRRDRATADLRDRTVALTDAGRDVLARRADHVAAQRHRRVARRRPSDRIGPQPVAMGRARRNVGIMTQSPMSELKDQPLHANSSEAVTQQRARRSRVAVRARALAAVPARVVLPLHRAHHQRRRRDGAAAQPPLDHHRRHRPDRGSQRRRAWSASSRCCAPGESFQYTSGCPLKTSTGVMRGTYQMVTEDGDHFDVEIAPFALHEPYTVH